MFRLDQIWPAFSGLTALTGANTASGDELGIVDVSAKVTKKITRDELAVAVAAGFAADGVAGAKVADATETTVGVSERATDAEAVTGTDTDRHVTPANLTARLAAPGTIGGTTPAAGIFTDITGGGNYTNPLQPCFLVKNNVTDLNVTGDGTLATIDFDTEIFDQGSDFASDTFTAPVTGRYFLNTSVRFAGMLTAGNTIIFAIVASNRSIRSILIGGLGSTETIMLSSVVDMDADDTATVTLNVAGESSDIVDISGDGVDTTFSGCLLA